MNFGRHLPMLAGLGIMLVAGLAAWPFLGVRASLLVGWDAGILLYLVLALTTACGMSPAALRASCRPPQKKYKTA